MNNSVCFKTRDEFRNWLIEHCQSDEGIWLQFSKSKEFITLKASEALEEALCYGWIDGVMKKRDDTSYIKYFTKRRKNSKWSEKNKALVIRLENNGLMTEYGRLKIEEAKQNGQWEKDQTLPSVELEQMETILELLKENEQAYANFQAMSPSVKKTYTRAYFDAKTDAGRVKRKVWMMERLEKNLKPM